MANLKQAANVESGQRFLVEAGAKSMFKRFSSTGGFPSSLRSAHLLFDSLGFVRT